MGKRARQDPVDSGTGAQGGAELLRDADRPAAWVLLVDGVAQSHVDLDDPRYLDFEYVRRLGHVIDTAAPRRAAAARAAPGRRGPDAGPVRRGHPAGLGPAGRRCRRRAGRPGPAQAAGARGPGPDPDRGCAGGARAAAARLVRRGDRRRVRGRPDARPPDLSGVRGGGPAGAERDGRVRRQRGRRPAARARPGAGRDGTRDLPAGGPHRRAGSAARPEVRQPGAGREPGAAPVGRADPAGGRGSHARQGPPRPGADPLRGGRQAGHRRGGQPLPHASRRGIRPVSAAWPGTPGGRRGLRAWPGPGPRRAPGCPRSRTPRAAAARRTGGRPPRGTRK